MKLRTDFVTNSSSSSFLIFSVKNQKLYDFLMSIGLKFKDVEGGEFNDRMTVVLPSGNKIKFGYEETDSLPAPPEDSSIASWLIQYLLFEVENVCSEEELGGCSDSTKELLELLRNNNVLNFSFNEMNFDKLDEIDKFTEDVEIEMNEGFEGAVVLLKMYSARKGYLLLISVEECGEYEVEDLEGLNIYIHDEELSLENKEKLIAFIQQEKGIVADKLTEDVDYLICNSFDWEDEKINFAKDVCIPIISEQGFMYRFGNNSPFENKDEEEEINEMLFECTWEGGFRDIFYHYGIGTVTRKKIEQKSHS